jgi:hypothetical protein
MIGAGLAVGLGFPFVGQKKTIDRCHAVEIASLVGPALSCSRDQPPPPPGGFGSLLGKSFHAVKKHLVFVQTQSVGV